VQLFYNLSDTVMEDAFYEIESMRRFAGLCTTGQISGETTILNFRYLLEKHKFGWALFALINKLLIQEDLTVKEGTIIDAMIISAPSLTKKVGKRDEKMSSTRKINQPCFDMKMHIETDASVSCINSIDTTPAIEHDITAADKSLRGEEKRVSADVGYLGIDKLEEHQAREVEWFIACRPDNPNRYPKIVLCAQQKILKRRWKRKWNILFLAIKRRFGYNKVRYKVLAKNNYRLCLLVRFYNLILMDQLAH